MRINSKFLTAFMILLMTVNLRAQEEAPSLINFVPNANLVVVKINNANDLKTALENHPLRSLINSDKAKEFLDETLQIFDKEDVDITVKEIEKKVIDKIFTSFTGEVFLTITYKPAEVNKYDPRPRLICSIIAQADSGPFQAFIKAGAKYADKAVGQKTVTPQSHEGVEYTSLRVADDLPGSAFVSYVNGVGICSNDEETCQKMIKAVVKKTPYENGLKTNEKVISYFNANAKKDILCFADLIPYFKNEMANEKSSTKTAMEMLKLDKLFQINAAIDIDEKGDSFDVVLNALDDGFLQLAAFTNNEFSPSPFVSAESFSYTRIFFSISELKKKLNEIAAKISAQNPNPSLKSLVEVLDIDAVCGSMGDDYESFSVLNKENTAEELCVNKLKNQSAFVTNFPKLLSQPMIKLAMGSATSVIETKEVASQIWVFAFPSKDPNAKEERFAIGATETHAFVSTPGGLAKKHLSLIKEAKPGTLEYPFTSTRALFPSKLAIYGFAKTSQYINALKPKLKDQQAILTSIHPSFEKLIALIDETIAEDFKGSFSYGLTKDTNKLIFSAKLLSK